MNTKMELQFQIESQLGLALVRCSGRMVRGKALDAFRSRLEQLESARVIVVDLCKVEQLDAAGLGALLFVRRAARLNGVQMRLVNPSPLVLRVLAATRLTSVFEVSSLEEALAILQVPGERPHYAVA